MSYPLCGMMIISLAIYTATSQCTAEEEANAMETWVDKSGSYKIVATLISYDGKTVVLQREDGKTLRVEVGKLSDATKLRLDSKRSDERDVEEMRRRIMSLGDMQEAYNELLGEYYKPSPFDTRDERHKRLERLRKILIRELRNDEFYIVGIVSRAQMMRTRFDKRHRDKERTLRFRLSSMAYPKEEPHDFDLTVTERTEKVSDGMCVGLLCKVGDNTNVIGTYALPYAGDFKYISYCGIVGISILDKGVYDKVLADLAKGAPKPKKLDITPAQFVEKLMTLRTFRQHSGFVVSKDALHKAFGFPKIVDTSSGSGLWGYQCDRGEVTLKVGRYYVGSKVPTRDINPIDSELKVIIYHVTPDTQMLFPPQNEPLEGF